MTTEILGKEVSRAYVSAAQQERLEIAQQNAMRIIDKLAPVYVNETLELYTAPLGILVPNGQVLIGSALEELEGMYCTIQNQNLVLNHIKNSCVKTLAELDPSPDLIPVKNGAVSISTGELLPYKRGMTFHGQFPIVYDPRARAPNNMKFLKEILPDEMSRAHVLNAFARCFDRRATKREAEIFIGEHDTGKSTLLNILYHMMGSKNVASEVLQDLTGGQDRWALGNLFHKAVNICGELQNVEITEVGRWKRLTGGDVVTAEFKGKPKFEFAPYTKFFFACNSTPKILDNDIREDLAFFERFAITYFYRQFQPEEFDESLVILEDPESSKLINSSEISGLFNYCLGILRSMRRTKKLRYVFNGRETKAIWFHEYGSNKKVDDFLVLYTVKLEDGKIPVVEFKDRINSWLTKQHKLPLSGQQINQRMEELFGESKASKGGRYWRGLAWRDKANQSLDGHSSSSSPSPSSPKSEQSQCDGKFIDTPILGQRGSSPDDEKKPDLYGIESSEQLPCNGNSAYSKYHPPGDTKNIENFRCIAIAQPKDDSSFSIAQPSNNNSQANNIDTTGSVSPTTAGETLLGGTKGPWRPDLEGGQMERDGRKFLQCKEHRSLGWLGRSDWYEHVAKEHAAEESEKES